MKYKLLGHRVEKGRTVLIIEKKLFGFFKHTFECIDSDRVYATTKQTVWFYYSNFEKVGPFSKLLDFCESCMRKIEHDKK